jgi:hypothetical protein
MMNASPAMELDLGRTSAKYANRDELLVMLRRVIAENPGVSQADAVRLWGEALRDHEDYDAKLREEIETYVANAMWRRCTTPAGDEDRSTEAKAKEIIASEILLWTWKLPTTGKPLCECTFEEIAAAAPVTGRFLARLSTQGAPGTKVKEVFRDKDALQAFWRSAQE